MQFVVRELTTGPADLAAQLPVTVDALSTLTDDNGGTFWCVQLDQPVIYRISPGTPPPVNADPQFLAEDWEGPFLWVYVLVLTVRGGSPDHTVEGPDAAPASARHGVPIDVGYVVDLSLAADVILSPDKVRWTAVAVADIVELADGEHTLSGTDSTDDTAPPTAPHSDTVAPTLHAQHGIAGLVNEQIDIAIDQLAQLAGKNFSSDIPRAVQITEHEPLPENKPAYLVDGTTLRYHTVHPTQGWHWQETEDPDELVYWVMDDIVRSLAQRWAHAAPAAKTMSPSQVDATLWVPYWLTLLAALNPQWRANTARLIGP